MFKVEVESPFKTNKSKNQLKDQQISFHNDFIINNRYHTQLKRQKCLGENMCKVLIPKYTKNPLFK